MRSFEFTFSGSNNSKCHTITVRACNIQFFKHDIKLLPTSDLLHLTDYITITFRMSNYYEVEKTIIMHKINNPELCPVNIWEEIIYRLNSYPIFYPQCTVYTLFDEFLSNITILNVRKMICYSVRSINKDKLGFTEDDVGSHSNLSSAEIANVSVSQ